MKLKVIDAVTYCDLFPDSGLVYNSAEFNQINRSKCDNLIFLLFHDSKRKIGIIAGVIKSELISPFSAPFSCFSVNDTKMKFEYISEALLLLDGLADELQLSNVKFVLPPFFYNENLISKIAICLAQNNYSSDLLVNHHLLSSDHISYVEGRVDKNLRYSIKTAMRFELVFRIASNADEYKLAYNVIELNKRSKERPQSMTFDQILEMTRLINIDFMLVLKEGNPIASAIVYNHTPEIVQIIFWGALPDTSRYYPMNFLVSNILKYYYEKGVRIIDLGTSMLGSRLNTGLINFKESIGARPSVKFSFSKRFEQ